MTTTTRILSGLLLCVSFPAFAAETTVSIAWTCKGACDSATTDVETSLRAVKGVKVQGTMSARTVLVYDDAHTSLAAIKKTIAGDKRITISQTNPSTTRKDSPKAWAADLDRVCNLFERAGTDPKQGFQPAAGWLAENIETRDMIDRFTVASFASDAKTWMKALEADAAAAGVKSCPFAGQMLAELERALENEKTKK